MANSGNSPVYDWGEENDKNEIDNGSPLYEWENQDKYELLAWVKASERRVDILMSLAESPKNTTDFADEWGSSTEAVRYHLKQLKNGGPNGQVHSLVQVLTPDRLQYRLYGLTELGVEVADQL